MIPKNGVFLLIALLLVDPLGQAARPEPADPLRISDRQQVADVASMETMDEGCRGVGVEECLMRRTLAAHTDYIYNSGKQALIGKCVSYF